MLLVAGLAVVTSGLAFYLHRVSVFSIPLQVYFVPLISQTSTRPHSTKSHVIPVMPILIYLKVLWRKDIFNFSE
jgi:hypothetical protein